MCAVLPHPGVRRRRLGVLLLLLLLAAAPLRAGPSSDAPAVDRWVAKGPFGDFGSASQPFVNGRIRSIQLRPIPGDYHVYAGASSGGLWRARGSAGPVWASLGEALPNQSVGAFSVDPRNPDEILVGTGDYRRYGGAGMFATRDGGRSWTPVPLPAGVVPTAFFQIHHHPLDPNVVLAASDAGLFRSAAGAAGPWTRVLPGVVTDLVIHPANPAVLYLARASMGGVDGGIYRSTDGGQAWQRLATGVPSNGLGITRIALTRGAPGTIVFVHENGCRIADVRRSSDGGRTWASIASNLRGVGDEACHAMSIAIRPTDPNEIYVGANELWRSTDGGRTWWGLDKNIDPHQDHTRLHFDPLTGDGVLWMSNDGGLYRYRIGDAASSSWQGNGATGLAVAQVSVLDAVQSLRVIGLQDDGVASSTDAGAGWRGYRCCDVFDVAITDDLAPTFWYLQDGRAIRQGFAGGERDVRDPSRTLIRLFYDRFENKVYSLSGPELVSRPATAAAAGAWNVEIQLPTAMSGLHGNRLDGSTMYLWNPSPGSLTVLRKVAGAWSVERSLAIGSIGSITFNLLSIAGSTERRGEAWAGLSTLPWGPTGQAGVAVLLHTTNDWRTRTMLSALPSEVKQVTAIAPAPFNARQLYIATDVGVYRTDDRGASWTAFREGLPSVYCTGLRFLAGPDGQRLVVSTFGRGVYERLVDASPVIYVDQRNFGPERGTFEHPYISFQSGWAAAPAGGRLALRGGRHTFSGTLTLDKPVVIDAYDSAAEFGH